MGQFRDNNSGCSSSAPRRSSVHSHAQPSRQLVQRESNFPPPVDEPAPPPTTPKSGKGKKKASGLGSPSATQETRYASKGKRRPRPRSLSLTRSSTSQTPDESPALYGRPDDFDEDCELTEDRGSRIWYHKRRPGTPSRRKNEKQIDITKSDAASSTSIITNPSDLAVDIDGTLHETSEGKLIYEFKSDSPIEKLKNTGSSIKGKSEVDPVIEKNGKTPEKKKGEISTTANDRTTDDKSVETMGGLLSSLDSGSVQGVRDSTTALEVEQLKTTTLTGENSSAGQVKHEAQEKTQTEDLVDIPTSEEKSPHFGDDIKQTVLEVTRNPRRVVSASGEIDFFYDALETIPNPTTEQPRTNTASRFLPKEIEETVEYNPKAQQESSKISSDMDVKTTYLGGESHENLNTGGDPSAVTGALNLSPNAAQVKGVACAGDEVLVAPEQGSTLFTDNGRIKKPSEIASSSPATGKGKAKANPDSAEPTPTTKDKSSKSDDNWVHPMARARRQAKQEKQQAKKEREKEKKAKQQAKKGNQDSNDISADNSAMGKTHQQ